MKAIISKAVILVMTIMTVMACTDKKQEIDEDPLEKTTWVTQDGNTTISFDSAKKGMMRTVTKIDPEDKNQDAITLRVIYKFDYALLGTVVCVAYTDAVVTIDGESEQVDCDSKSVQMLYDRKTRTLTMNEDEKDGGKLVLKQVTYSPIGWPEPIRHPVGYDRHVVMLFDWSQVETRSDLPKTFKVVFHNPETGEITDFNLPTDMEGQEIIIPSGIKHLYIYNTDETDFAGHIDPSDWHKNYLYMLPSYRGLKKVYLFSEDVTVLPPEIGKELEPQIVKVTPTCRTTHFDVTVNNPNSKNVKGDIVTWAVAFVDMYPYYTEDYSTIEAKDPVNIRYPLRWNNTGNALYGSLRTFNFLKQSSPLARYMLYVSSADIFTDEIYYRFDVTDQVKAQEGAHIYHFVVDLTGIMPISKAEEPKFE